MKRSTSNPLQGRLPGRALAVGLALAALTPVASSLAAGAAAKPAAGATRSAVLKAFAAADGNASEVKGIYVSRSNAALAVVCEKTPEAGYRAYVFAGAHGSWRLSALGVPGRAGNSSDRQVERACP